MSDRVLVSIFMVFFRASSLPDSGATDTNAQNDNVQEEAKYAQQIVLLNQITGNSINVIF